PVYTFHSLFTSQNRPSRILTYPPGNSKIHIPVHAGRFPDTFLPPESRTFPLPDLPCGNTVLNGGSEQSQNFPAVFLSSAPLFSILFLLFSTFLSGTWQKI